MSKQSGSLRGVLLATAVGWVLACGAAALWAESGPEIGSQPPPLKGYGATGEFAEKTVDFAAERKAKTTLYLFVNSSEWARPVARYLKTLDTEIDKGVPGAKEPAVIAVWLTDDVNQAKEYLPKAQMSLQFSKTTLAVFDGPKQGPDGWNIDVAATVTAVVVHDGKVTARFNYQSLNETDAPTVLKALGKSP